MLGTRTRERFCAWFKLAYAQPVENSPANSKAYATSVRKHAAVPSCSRLQQCTRDLRSGIKRHASSASVSALEGFELDDVTARAQSSEEASTSRRQSKRVLKDMSFAEMQQYVVELGEKPKRALHLWRWLYHDLASHPEDVPKATGLSRDFRAKLAQVAEFSVLELADLRKAKDGTTKLLFRLPSGSMVEAVMIPAKGRNTLCVSSQVGCAMNCQFCFTGRLGLLGNMTTAQIVEQLVIARRVLTDEVGPITNVVFMGMGEPLQNIDNVIRAVDIMVDLKGLHLSHKKVTVSTSGLVPQIRRFCRESPASLAVSLNATIDEVRSWIMPINRKYNLDTLLTCLREEFPRANGQERVMVEYVMLRGINDSLEDAHRLVELVQGLPCQINLIHFNHHSGSEFAPSSLDQLTAFYKVLSASGLFVTTRESRGDDEMAACGQLGQLGETLQPPPRMKPPERFRAVLASNAAM